MRFELNIDDRYADMDMVDEWGCAYYYGDNGTGVEYNLYRDDMDNCSAIYWFESDEYLSTNYDEYVHYEIDFSDDEWEYKLQSKMEEVYNYFRKKLDK